MSKRVSNKRGKQRVSPARDRSRLGWNRTMRLSHLRANYDKLSERKSDEITRQGFTVKEAMQGIMDSIKSISPKSTMRRHQGR